MLFLITQMYVIYHCIFHYTLSATFLGRLISIDNLVI